MNDPNSMLTAGQLAVMAVVVVPPREALNRIRAWAARGPVTLLTAARDLSLSQAAVLADLLRHDA